MHVGVVGLGKMGLNIARRLVAGGFSVSGYDPAEDARKEADSAGAAAASSLAELVQGLKAPRIVWVMVPAGRVTGEVVISLAQTLQPGDILIDGGNSRYGDSQQRAEELARKGVVLLDCGTSGGLRGGEDGYCLMIGGPVEAYAKAEPVFRCLAQKDGSLHVGPSGAGHYVKMVHNAIEYALMEAYGEGFELLAAKREFDLDLEAVARLWGHGSVIRSWLLELAAAAFAKAPNLEDIQGYVADTGEGRWAVNDALDQGVPVPAIMLALTQRHRSRQHESFSAKVVAALRHEFGGHEVKSK